MTNESNTVTITDLSDTLGSIIAAGAKITTRAYDETAKLGLQICRKYGLTVDSDSTDDKLASSINSAVRTLVCENEDAGKDPLVADWRKAFVRYAKFRDKVHWMVQDAGDMIWYLERGVLE